MVVNILVPTVPNFVRIAIEGKIHTRQEGLKELPTIPVGDLSDEQLEQLASDWKKALFENAKRQRENNNVEK